MSTCRRISTDLERHDRLRHQMASSLPDLPVELFDAIIYELSTSRISHSEHRKGLKSLQLACRTVEVKTRRRFGREFCTSSGFVVPPLKFPGDYPDIVGDSIFQNTIGLVEF